MTILYDLGNALYCNLTNRCPCDCDFCIRTYSDGMAGQSLWLDHEPSYDEIKAAISGAELARYDEFVFCGFGEPTERLDALLYTAWLARQQAKISIRLNTNGLSDLINGKETVPLLARHIDSVSVSLNAPDKETYYALCRPRFGMDAYDAMIRFALACKAHTSLDVCFSVVGRALDDEQLCQCRRLCEELEIRMRVR